MQLHLTIVMVTIVMITIVMVTIVTGMLSMTFISVLVMLHWLMNVVVNIGTLRNVNLHTMDS